MNTAEKEIQINQAKPRRYVGLDILKFLCAFMVVSIHSKMRGDYVPYYISITRVAVPVFFLITGFFYHNTQEKGTQLKQIKKIALLTLSANILFLLWEIVVYFYNNEGWEYLRGVFSLSALRDFLFFNVSPCCGHLWYLGAILYVLIIAYWADKFGFKKILYVLTPVLLISDLVFGNYSIMIFGNHIPGKFVRNFYCVGIPYFCIGNILYRKMDSILEIKKITLKSGIFSLIFMVSTILEKRFLVITSSVATRDHALSILPLAVSLFIFFMAFYRDRKPSYIEQKMALIGNSFSTKIYILHPVFIRFLIFTTTGFGFYEAYRFVSNICVFALTTAVILIYSYFLNKDFKK